MKKILTLISAISLTASTSAFSISCSNNNKENNSEDDNSADDNLDPSNYPNIKDWEVVTNKKEFFNSNTSVYFAVWNDNDTQTSFKINIFVNNEKLNLNEKQTIETGNEYYNLVLARLGNEGKNERNLYTWNSSNNLYKKFGSENSDIKYVYKYVGNDPTNIYLPTIDEKTGLFT